MRTVPVRMDAAPERGRLFSGGFVLILERGVTHQLQLIGGDFP
jgi:hypothetical protein